MDEKDIRTMMEHRGENAGQLIPSQYCLMECTSVEELEHFANIGRMLVFAKPFIVGGAVISTAGSLLISGALTLWTGTFGALACGALALMLNGNTRWY